MRRLAARLRRFGADRSGTSTVDFVVMFVPVILIFVAVLEVGVSFYALVASQKAASVGARLAITRAPIHADVPLTNVVDASVAQLGDACYQPDGTFACIDPGGPWVCDGDTVASDPACDTTAFDGLLNEMSRVYPLASGGALDRSLVDVTYTYRALGFANGPFAPEVTVTIESRNSPFQLFSLVALLNDAFFAREEDFEGFAGGAGSVVLKAVSASAFGEDLDSTN